MDSSHAFPSCVALTALVVGACGGPIDLHKPHATVGSSGYAGDGAAGAATNAGNGAMPAIAGSGASGGDTSASDGAGAGISAGTSAGGAGGTLTLESPAPPGYQVTGAWPTRPALLASRAGKLSYTKLEVHNRFLAESCAIGDYDGDGSPDVSSGRRWYAGPDFKTEHIYRGTPLSEFGHDDLPRAGDSPEIDSGVSDDWADFAYDLDGDGNTDIINIANDQVAEAKNPSPKPAPQPRASAYWYKNPGAAAGDVKWQPYLMHADVRLDQHGLTDVNGDGYPEIFGACKNCSPGNTKGFFQGDRANPTAPWTYHAVNQPYALPSGGTGLTHGIGFGDVNGDAKPDLLDRELAWVDALAEQPNGTPCPGAGCGLVKIWAASGDQGGNRGPSHMYATDVDGDGDADVVAADWAYGWGLAWHEQTAPGTFIRRQIMGTNSAADVAKYGQVVFSELHAVEVADMNADGVPDIITGKMRFAHPISYGDPDPMGTPLVVVFEGQRLTPSAANGGSVTFVPHVVDMQTGVGRQLGIGHLNTDGILDFCVASKLGLYVFLGQ